MAFSVVRNANRDSVDVLCSRQAFHRGYGVFVDFEWAVVQCVQFFFCLAPKFGHSWRFSELYSAKKSKFSKIIFKNTTCPKDDQGNFENFNFLAENYSENLQKDQIED